MYVQKRPDEVKHIHLQFNIPIAKKVNTIDTYRHFEESMFRKNLIL